MSHEVVQRFHFFFSVKTFKNWNDIFFYSSRYNLAMKIPQRSKLLDKKKRKKKQNIEQWSSEYHKKQRERSVESKKKEA